jgi:hypothetical protein
VLPDKQRLFMVPVEDHPVANHPAEADLPMVANPAVVQQSL